MIPHYFPTSPKMNKKIKNIENYAIICPTDTILVVMFKQK
jgi:hypothetical protein